MTAIFKREFRSYFTTPVGYIYLAAIYFFSAQFFADVYKDGTADMRKVFSNLYLLLIFIIPVLTMRLMSEDKRQKVDQVLFTAPVRPIGMALGKYLAAVSVFTIGFAPTLFYQMIFASLVKGLQWFPYWYSLFGMLLLGGALIAIGMFISCLTENAATAGILALFTNIAILLTPLFANQASKWEWLSILLQKLAFINAYDNFNKNIFSVPDVLYFVSISAAFLFLCSRVLDMRRWA